MIEDTNLKAIHNKEFATLNLPSDVFNDRRYKFESNSQQEIKSAILAFSCFQ